MADQTKKLLKVEDVGEYFIYLANQEKKPITNKKLQKLVYYAQAWFLVLNNNKLFNERIEAWVHGPTVRSLYVQYKEFGFNPIQKTVNLEDIKIPKKIKEFLNEIWKVYGKFDAGYLEMLTHSEKPWQEAREGLQLFEGSDNQISLKTMRDYYLKKLKKH